MCSGMPHDYYVKHINRATETLKLQFSRPFQMNSIKLLKNQLSKNHGRHTLNITHWAYLKISLLK